MAVIYFPLSLHQLHTLIHPPPSQYNNKKNERNNKTKSDFLFCAHPSHYNISVNFKSRPETYLALVWSGGEEKSIVSKLLS